MNVGRNLTRGDSGILSEPFAFFRVGTYDSFLAGNYNIGRTGSYWSSVAYSRAGSRYHDFSSSAFDLKTGWFRGYGFGIRC
ncbi:hypothetical protein IKG02_02090 [Candidatus Saccharibacteria bacterium]|nr:hypothetical protein [Candidatus Saccharibacteria bacterium]